MHLFRVVHGIVTRRQKHLPLTITYPDVVEIATGFITNTVVDIINAYHIIRDSLLIWTGQLHRYPDMIFLAVHLFLNRVKLFDAVAQNARFVATYLHFTTYNHDFVLDPQFRRFFVKPGEDRYKETDRKSTRLNSSHITISYAVFCLKKKKKRHNIKINEKKKYEKQHTSKHSTNT